MDHRLQLQGIQPADVHEFQPANDSLNRDNV
jgi:hypothetical protein